MLGESWKVKVVEPTSPGQRDRVPAGAMKDNKGGNIGGQAHRNTPN